MNYPHCPLARLASLAAGILLTCVWIFAQVQSCAAAEPRRMNIVLLYADDWRHDTLGCAGHKIVRTPRLDELAKQSVRFTHNYVTTSICGVSRASLFTGQWMSRHGNQAFAAFRTPWDETYPGLLRRHGYYVGHVGKWHNGVFPADKFDFGRSYQGRHWMTEADGSKIHVTQKNERDALAFLATRPANKPFCLTLSFFATHAEDSHPEQYLPQPESMSLYEDATIPTPETATPEHFQRLPGFLATEKNEGRIRWRWRFDTPERYQKYMKNYYRLATEVDAVCGRVIDELQSQGVWDDTLVIFTTDNGYFHAEHELADKWYPYEESIRVPLIVRDPRLKAEKQGSLSDAMTLNVDLAPTILGAAGVVSPNAMQGRDLAPLYLSKQPPEWRNDFFYEHATISNRNRIPASQALVRKDWKYLYWPEFEHEELFHLERDRGETRNLAADPNHSERLEAMRKRFAELRQAAR